MYIAPSSTVKLYSGVQIIPGRQIAFSSKANQTAYFASKLVQSDTPCTYVRRTYSVKVEVALSVVKNCNYISFVNPDFENITWYARITNYEYVNNACTEIFYAIDYFQTFMFDVNFEVCTIDREQLSVTDYAKSENNPYDYSIVEMRTDENIPLPDEVFNFPTVGDTSGTRTFLPGGYEDTGNEQIAQSTYLYTILLSSPVTKLTAVESAYEGLLPSDVVIRMCNACGFASAVSSSGNLPIGISIPVNKLVHADGSANAYKGGSWCVWAPSGSSWTNPYNTNEHISFGFGSLVSYMNNNPTQTLILATTSYSAMQGILDDLAENDAVSSIQGMYLLPFTFLANLHANSETSIQDPNSWSTSGGVGPFTDDIGESAPASFVETINPVFQSGIKNKKLYTFPYQYIKVSSPDGSAKEYKFEDFTDLQSLNSGLASDFDCKFLYMTDISGKPIMGVYPYDYKMFFDATYNYRHRLNAEERFEYTDIPQVAYMTDAYLAYVGSQYSEQMKLEPMRENMKTQKYMYDNYDKWANKVDTYGAVGYVGDYLSMGGSALSGEGNMSAIGASMKGVGTTIGKAQLMNMKTAEYATNIQKNQAALNLRQEANNWANTGEIGPQLSAAKPAFRVNNYVAGGGVGAMANYLNGMRFMFDVITLKTAFLQKFDEYFTNYGYKSTRTGVPHIATYLGGTKTGNAPKFLQNSQGYYVTYVKTVDCKVYSSMELITEFFESLFNAGIQLIDGDTLLPSNNK